VSQKCESNDKENKRKYFLFHQALIRISIIITELIFVQQFYVYHFLSKKVKINNLPKFFNDFYTPGTRIILYQI